MGTDRCSSPIEPMAAGRRIFAARFFRNGKLPLPDLRNSDHNARENARKLENSFVNNWLIVQNAELENEDDEQTHDWKSRDIAPQQTVFVGVKVDNFLAGESSTELIKNRMDFRKWQLKHGVQIYAYQLEMAQRIGAIEKHQIIVGEDSEEVWLVNDDYYDLKYGLRLQREVENYDDFE